MSWTVSLPWMISGVRIVVSYPTLVDWELLIEGEMLISPFDPDKVQPNSVDLTLGREFAEIADNMIDVKENINYRFVEGDEYVLKPHGFVLATTNEKITLPNAYMAKVEGKSSLGRIGLAVHVTAGFIDTGFEGNITLELSNQTDKYIKLYAGMDICQIVFDRCTHVRNLYDGKYCGQEGVTVSRIRENFR